MLIRTGNTYKFSTTQSDLLQHNGKDVKVIRALTDQEADLSDVGPMYKVATSDGSMLDVFEDELSTC